MPSPGHPSAAPLTATLLLSGGADPCQWTSAGSRGLGADGALMAALPGFSASWAGCRGRGHHGAAPGPSGPPCGREAPNAVVNPEWLR